MYCFNRNNFQFSPVFLLGLFLWAIVSSGWSNPNQTDSPLCGHPEIHTDGYRQALKKFNAMPKSIRADLSNKFEHSFSNNTRSFWAYNFKSQSFYLVEATLRRSGSLCRIWVENQSWNDGYVNDEVLNKLLEGLEQKSGKTSIAPNMGIFQIDTLLFGEPPDIDNNQFIDVLLLDIKDNFNGSTENAYYAGYFSPTDQINDPSHPNYPVSNRADLIYLDTSPAIYYHGTYNLNQVLSTTAHEFQHLIHYRYDADEAIWVNESMSELAGTYCGYGLDHSYLYLQETNVPLNQFTNQVKDYARVNLWGLYLAEQFGQNFIKKLVQNPFKGIVGIENTLSQIASPLNFESVFRNWAICNIINDTLTFPEFGYRHPEALNIRAFPEKVVKEYPASNISGYVNEWAISYHRFRGSDSLVIHNNSGAASIWVTDNAGNLNLINDLPPRFELPNFSDETDNWLVWYSNSGTQFYSYDASANYSLLFYELMVDDGSVNSGVQFTNVPATAAVRFSSPAEPLFLESITFWSRDNDYTANGTVFEALVDGKPGNELTAPAEVNVGSRDCWIELDFRGVNLLMAPFTVFFAGIKIPIQNVALGLDSDSPYLNRSYVKTNGAWRLLTEAGNFSGNWMIRARLSRLLLSDSLQVGNNAREFKILSLYPNPVFSGGEFQLEFNSPDAGYLTVQIYDIAGRLVKRHQTPVNSGISIYRVKAASENGRLPAGIYFIRIDLKSPLKKHRSDVYKLIVVN